jgi:Uracil phosphoribosyltransferase
MQYKDFANVHVMDHPLIKHKISLLRKIETGTYEFRHLVEEIATLEGYEALRDLPLKMSRLRHLLKRQWLP